MADDPHNTSDISDPAAGNDSPRPEDAETRATREELKQTVISDKSQDSTAAEEGAAKPSESGGGGGGGGAAATAAAATVNDDDDDEKTSPTTAAAEAAAVTRGRNRDTPDLDRPRQHCRVSSPKKKRAHEDEEDETESGSGKGSREDGANGAAVTSRSDRTEPEKKRPRDRGVEGVGGDAVEEQQKADTELKAETTAKPAEAAATDVKGSDPPKTSSSAFASSGFAKLTSTASPFGSLGGSSKPSVFGAASGTGSKSPFGALADPKPSTPTLSFGSKDEKSGSSSPFGTLNNNASGGSKPSFGGSAFGSGFGSAIGATKLSSFAKPGEVFKSDKPSKPFGAPDSDAEEESGDESGGDETSAAEESVAEEKESEDAKAEEKKRTRLQKVAINDGEAGEATILSVRAKLYYSDMALGKWTERGAGMLKLNVPERCVEFDGDGNAIAASFDASTLDDDEGDEEEAGDVSRSKVVRLIMRQDSTHRVILNTVILPSTDFQERTSLNSVTLLFTSFEEGVAKPASVKMNVQNAKIFLATMQGVQKELRDV